MPLIGPLAVAFVVALGVTPVLRRISHRLELLDQPNERSSHAHPTPRNGGIAIVLGLIAALAIFGEWRDIRFVFVLVWAGMIAGLGLLDDLRSQSAKARLSVQLAAAVATIAAADVTLRWVELPFVGDLRFPIWVAVPLTLFWIVGMTNAYNFMDGVNGIASVEAIVCGLAYTALFVIQGDEAGTVLSMAIVGGAAGFLLFNASGTIFMGDVGSNTLGFLFAVLALRLTYWDVPFFATFLPLLPFLFDTALTLVKRALRGDRLFSAHRTHYYQRLTDLGWSHLAVAGTYGALAAACSLVAITWKMFTPVGLVWAVLGQVSIFAILAAVIEWRCHLRQS